MQIAVPTEQWPNERRVALIPDSVKKLARAGFSIHVQDGCGNESGYSNEDYTEAGATVSSDREAMLKSSDIILRVRKPDASEVNLLKSGALHISYLDPYNEPELLDSMAQQGVSAISMEMIPRTTRAQKMDALSSQANLAGYVMVMLAAQKIDRIVPMMMTPAGTLSPAKVFVIGAGVAGLQAIATAKRLGGRVEAFDTSWRNGSDRRWLCERADLSSISASERGNEKNNIRSRHCNHHCSSFRASCSKNRNC